MLIRFLIGNVFGGGGTIRTTINTANALVERHQVEIVSVVRRKTVPTFPIDPRVTVRSLVDTSTPTRNAKKDRLGLQRRWDEYGAKVPSLMIHRGDYRYNILFDARTDVRLMQFLATTRDGILVSTRPGLNLAVARYGRKSVIKIGQEHTSLQRHGPELRDAFAQHYPKLDAVTALTPDDAQAYTELLGPDFRVLAMPNAIPDMGGLRSTLDNKTVVAAGRLTKLKGFDRLIKAFAQVVSKHPDWHLRIFGDGPTREDLERQVRRLRVGDNVHLMGFTSQLPQEMADASLLAVSSHAEGFSMVILEGMACGLPVVSFDCPHGPRMLINPGVDGLLIPNDDIDGLAGGLLELIEDPSRRKALGTAAVDKAALYQMDATVQRWEQLFSDLEAARKRRV